MAAATINGHWSAWVEDMETLPGFEDNPALRIEIIFDDETQREEFEAELIQYVDN